MTAPRAPGPTFAALDTAAAACGLRAVGGFHARADDGLPARIASVVLLAPREPEFWPRVMAEPEFADGRPDPLDRWSRRVIGRLACARGAKALFPFSGPPWWPFLSWALRTGRLHRSPVGLLVDPQAGLWVSLRGALALRTPVDLPGAVPSPCADCPAQPCRTACPVGALGGDAYDAGTCRAHLAAPDGGDCMDKGCRARRSCPVSADHPRSPAQSAFHMRAFAGATAGAP